MKRNSEKTPDSTNRIQIVFAGTRIGSDKKRFFLYCIDFSIPSPTKYLSFDKKLLGYEAIGAIMEVERTDEGVKGPYKPLRTLLPDNKGYKNVLSWSLNDRLAKEEYQTVMSLKKGCVDNTLDSLVNEICTASGSLNLREKIKLARYVFEKIIL